MELTDAQHLFHVICAQLDNLYALAAVLLDQDHEGSATAQMCTLSDALKDAVDSVPEILILG